jgi:hypothetical protein
MLLLDKKIRSIEPPTKHFKAISYSVSSFLHVFLLIAICEPVIEVVMMPVFDVELGGGIPLDY